MTFLRVEDVTRRYNTCYRSLRRWIVAGNFPPPTKIGRALRWSLESLLEWEHQTGLRPRQETQAIIQALIGPAIEVALILRGDAAGPWLERFMQQRAKCKTNAEKIAFFQKTLPELLSPIIEHAGKQDPTSPATMAAVALLSTALGDNAVVADLVLPFAAAISRQADVVSYLQSTILRITTARENKLSLFELWQLESRLLFSAFAEKTSDELCTKTAVNAIFDTVPAGPSADAGTPPPVR